MIRQTGFPREILSSFFPAPLLIKARTVRENPGSLCLETMLGTIAAIVKKTALLPAKRPHPDPGLQTGTLIKMFTLTAICVK